MNDTKPRYGISRYVGILAGALVVIAVIYLYFCWGAQTTILLIVTPTGREAPTP